MTDNLLVLGGSGFVGPAVAEAGLARGFDVTTFHRTAAGWRHPQVRAPLRAGAMPAGLAPDREREVLRVWAAR
jgi:nucleoside-diphosphate-sugar epimerase